MPSSRIILSLFLCLLTVVSCGKKEQNSTDLSSVKGGIYGIEAQNRTQFIGILKLKTPPLLSKLKKENGVNVIDEKLKEELEKEQKDFIEGLKTLSPKVRILNQYKLVINAVTVLAPIELKKQIGEMSSLSYIESEGHFKRPKSQTILSGNGLENSTLDERNSVTFINAHKVHKDLNIKGKGIKVGIIDTGIDYTHKMMGGNGDIEEFKKVDPNGDTPHFPNAKVVGGIDLVGTEYSSGHTIFENRIPKPDKNPMDEGGHGTHVAGSVAGIGDGVNTYSGVAPEALLYAIKVFGAKGSTGDHVIIAALEYSADPNGDLKLDDKLDVVNLSLGSGYGKPFNLYQEAVKNLVASGTVTVASAGNSGHEPFIVGAPGTSDDAISVAAGIDYMDHNWQFDAVKFHDKNGFELIAEAVEGDISAEISKLKDPVSGKLVHIGDAAQDLTKEQVEAVKGHVALIDRGKVTFVEKLERAKKAGAIGVIVANNRDGESIVMGGDKKIELPAIMITLANGNKLKEKMKAGDVTVDFKAKEKIKKPEMIDTLTGFSSRGPRSQDSKIKPEITAPGYSIISAGVGKGDKGVKMSGTSMSGPHIAGVMALLVEKHKDLNPYELKSVLMNTAKSISDSDKKEYPVSQQGAGRVQVDKAANASLVTLPYSLSLGNNQVSSKKMVRRKVKVKNITKEDVELTISAKTDEGLKITYQETLSLKAGEEKEVSLRVIFDGTKDQKETSSELDGFLLFFKKGEEAKIGNELARIPVLGIINRVSKIKSKLEVYADSEEGSAGAASDLTLQNLGRNKGEALIFNLLGTDERKAKFGVTNSNRSRNCDLQAAGYRVIKKEINKVETTVVQFLAKLYNPVTTWQACEINVQIDGDQDGKTDQELVGIIHDGLPGLEGDYYDSFLLDHKKLRSLRKAHEEALAKDPKAKKSEDYNAAIVGYSEMNFYNHSTIAVIEADLSKVAKTSNGEISLKLSVINEDSAAIDSYDYLADQEKTWFKINPDTNSMGYYGMPEKTSIEAGSESTVELTKGEGAHGLMIFYPQNKYVLSDTLTDSQFEVIRPNYVEF